MSYHFEVLRTHILLQCKGPNNSNVEKDLSQSSTGFFSSFVASRFPFTADNGIAFNCAHNDRQRCESDERELPGYDKCPHDSGNDHDCDCDEDGYESADDVAHFFGVSIEAF